MKIARLLAVAVAGTVTTAQAQTVNFVGSNIGCFYTGSACTPTGSTTNTVSDGFALSYLGSTFNANTSDGYLGIGSTPGSPNVDNLGSFTLANTTHNYLTSPVNFAFQTTFTAPTNTTALFTAFVKGSVINNGNGGVTIDVDNTPQTFTYAGGAFTYSVNDVSVLNGQTAALTGQITSTVPEPSSMALLGTGLVGLVPMVRRRKHG